jgi:hypothetical protein
LTPGFSPDQQPDNPSSKRPIGQGGGERISIPISQEMLLKMRQEGALVIREADWRRFVKTVRNLDGYSSNWLAAGWAMVGVAVTLAGVAATVSPYALVIGVVAVLCGMGAAGCFAAHRDVNRKRRDAAEELAQEMEEAGDVDRPPMATRRPEARGDPRRT